jgi:hypothetical protein
MRTNPLYKGGLNMSKLLKKALSFVLLGSMVLSIAACAPKGVRSLTKDQFKDAIMNAGVLAENNDFLSIKGPEGSKLECIQFGNDVRAKDGYYYNCVIAYLWNTDKDDEAKDMYDDAYSVMIDSGSFDGTVKEESTDKYAYFTVDGTTEEYPMQGYCYGGWYWSGNSFVFVYTTEDNDDHRGRIDSILDKLGFPKP